MSRGPQLGCRASIAIGLLAGALGCSRTGGNAGEPPAGTAVACSTCASGSGAVKPSDVPASDRGGEQPRAGRAAPEPQRDASAPIQPRSRDAATDDPPNEPAARDAAAAPAAAPATRVSDGGTRLQLVCSRTGNALVQWDDLRQQPHFARWTAVRGEWSYPAPLAFVEANVRDPYGSDRPMVIGRPPEARADAQMLTARFDPGPDAWSAVQTVEGSRLEVLRGIALDGGGSAYRFWLPGDRTKVFASAWSVNREGWSAPQEVFEGSGMFGLVGDGALLWSDRMSFAVRSFDFNQRLFAEPVEIRARTPNTSHIGALAIGRGDELLAAFAERTASGIDVTVSRFDPMFHAWQPLELALQLPASGDPRTSYGATPLTGARFDLVAQQVDTDDGSVEVHVAHRARGGDFRERTFTSDDPLALFEPVADGDGGVYAYWSDSLLYHGPDADDWTMTPVAGSRARSFVVFPAASGAFALGYVDRELVAYHHAGERAGHGGWLPARGLPPGTQPAIGSVAFAGCALDDDTALAVWPGDHTQQGGIWAAFVTP